MNQHEMVVVNEVVPNSKDYDREYVEKIQNMTITQTVVWGSESTVEI